MTSVSDVLAAVTDFLKDAQSLDIIKEFTLTKCDVNYAEIPGSDILLSQFLQKINVPSIPTKSSSSDEEYIIIEDEKKSESDSAIESPNKEHSEMQVHTNEVSVESYSSSVPEQVSEEEKKPENISISYSPEEVPSENIPEHSKMMVENKEDDTFEFPVKKDMVQINVDTNEMKRRISAFMSRKRKEVDEWNVQEFCGRSFIDEQDPAWEQLDSCARVDAVFVPRRGCKSHIKVSKVQNVWGPQTQPSEAKKIKQEPGENDNQLNDASLQAIDERLLNMETHLKLKSDSILRSNIFKRLRNLEDRILLLESSSPEYIYMLNPDSSPKKKKRNSEEKIYSNCSVDEIQKRIQTLKDSLKMKALHVRSEPNV